MSRDPGPGSAPDAAPARRPTRQRRLVLDVLTGGAGFISAQDLHAALRGRGEGVGLATVYRTLGAMAAEGTLDVLHTDDGQTRYRRCEARVHHHHLVCRNCGRTVEVQGADVETWAAGTAAAHGFTDVSHTLEVFGRCPDCTGETGGAGDEISRTASGTRSGSAAGRY